MENQIGKEHGKSNGNWDYIGAICVVFYHDSMMCSWGPSLTTYSKLSWMQPRKDAAAGYCTEQVTRWASGPT